MGSRYALRELEGAIGYDCRRLEDGRRAVFRHTAIHKKARQAFFERRDLLRVLVASYASTASFAANPRFDTDVSIDVVKGGRSDLVKAAFPYLKTKEDDATKSYDDYSAYFDELDAIEASKASPSVGGEPPK